MTDAALVTDAHRRVHAKLERRVMPSSKAKGTHPMPTKGEAWAAFCKAAEDDHRTPDAEAFERWWRGE